ncbi:MAG: CbtB-domain containing protein [Acidimicrobiia bacterium]|nr:CbtB-domain containing protein [Acidimicrobiia bacterium]
MRVTTAAVETRDMALPVPWALWAAAVISLILGYLLFSENGAVLTEHWTLLHEVTHDGRHILGVPCH